MDEPQIISDNDEDGIDPICEGPNEPIGWADKSLRQPKLKNGQNGCGHHNRLTDTQAIPGFRFGGGRSHGNALTRPTQEGCSAPPLGSGRRQAHPKHPRPV